MEIAIMSKPKIISGSEDPSTPTEAPDPFDLEALTLTQDFMETAGAKKLLITVPVRKPNRQEFVRVHPLTDFRRQLALLKWEDDREYFVVTPAIAAAMPEETIGAE